MALSFDDRILGEKVDYYCSSSEDEGCNFGVKKDGDGIEEIPPSNYSNYSGSAANTGPKGVIEDWRRYKQLEAEQREEQNAERIRLAQKLSLTCRTTEEDEAAKEIEELLNGDEEDKFLKQYRIQRLQAMHKQIEIRSRFGLIYELTRISFLEAIDNEQPEVTILIHIYKQNLPGCKSMLDSFNCLCQEHTDIKFCNLSISESPLSLHFSLNALPALLVYKNKELIGNFIRITDNLGEDFCASDLEGFLLEHGFLNDEISYKKSIRDSMNRKLDSDSDNDI